MANFDAMLIERAQNGDTESLTELMRLYGPSLERIIRPLTRNREDLNDIVQNTWIRALLALRSGKYRHEGRFLAWLCRIGKHLAHDRIRGERKDLPLGEHFDIPDTSHQPDATVTLQAVFESLIDEISAAFGCDPHAPASTPEAYLKQLSFLYFYRDCFTLAEVAELLAADAQAVQTTAPSLATLNNWLSGGRLLRKVVDHLLLVCPENFEALGTQLVEEADLTTREYRTWVRYVETDLTPRPAPSAEVVAVRAKISGFVNKQVFQSLHNSRLRALKPAGRV